jgi:magnesium-transporting ATPase (P-type)
MTRYPLYFEIGYIFSVIEIPSSAIIIIICILSPELRSSSHVCILWLALSTFILGATYIGLASPKEGSVACFAQYFAQQYFSLTIFLSVVLFASHIGSLNFVFLQERQRFELTIKSYVFVWGTSLLLTILPLVTNSTGKIFSDDIVSICWISNKNDVNYIVMLVSYYMPLYSSAMYICFTCAKILWKARSKPSPFSYYYNSIFINTFLAIY